MKSAMLSRRGFLRCAPLFGVVTQKLLANDYLTTTLLVDGSLLYSGFRNGYVVQMILKAAGEGRVSRFEITLTAQRTVSVFSLLQSSGMEPVGKTNFSVGSPLNGHTLLVRLGDVAANYNVLINGVLFLDAGVSEKLVNAGQRVRAVALSGARLVGK